MDEYEKKPTKPYVRVLCIIGAILILLVFLFFQVFYAVPIAINTLFAETATISLYSANNEENPKVEVSDADFLVLKNMFARQATPKVRDYNTDYITIEFSGNGESLPLYLSAQYNVTGKVVVNEKDFYFKLNNSEVETLSALLAKYGFVWPNDV